MSNIICIKIPDELKRKFQSDKYLVPKREDINIEEYIQKIEKCLENDNLYGAIISISDIHYINPNYSIIGYGYYNKRGFYQEFSDWCDFALHQLVKPINVNISSHLEKVEVYSVFCNCGEKIKEIGIETDSKILISKAIEAVIEERNDTTNLDDNPEIRNMCSLFINIGKGKIIAHEFADISYETFLSTPYKKDQTSIDDETANKATYI